MYGLYFDLLYNDFKLKIKRNVLNIKFMRHCIIAYLLVSLFSVTVHAADNLKNSNDQVSSPPVEESKAQSPSSKSSDKQGAPER